MLHNEKSVRMRAALLLTLALAVGAVLGVTADRFVLLRQQRLLPSEGMTFAINRVVRQMDRELDLTDDQERSVREILNQRQSNIERQWNEVRPRVRYEIEQAELEIREVLEPDQIDGFDRLRDRWQRRARFLSGRTAPQDE